MLRAPEAGPASSSVETIDVVPLLDQVVAGLREAGLSDQRWAEAQQTQAFIEQELRFPELNAKWLDWPGDADSWERLILFLAIGHVYPQEDQAGQQQRWHLLGNLFPQRSRQQQLAFEQELNYREEEEETNDPLVEVVILVFANHKVFLLHPEWLVRLCPDERERERLYDSPESMIEWLYDQVVKQGNKKTLLDMRLCLRQLIGVPNLDRRGQIFYEFGVDLRAVPETRNFLEGWLQQKQLLAGPLHHAVYYRQPFPHLIYLSLADESTVCHEINHHDSDGLCINALGVGLNEGITELLTEEELMRRHGGLFRWRYRRQHGVQKKFYLDSPRRRPWGKLVNRINQADIDQNQCYEPEVALFLRLLQRYPHLRPAFERRYRELNRTTVLEFAAAVINEFGFGGYLDLFLLRPDQEGESEVGFLRATDVWRRLGQTGKR